MRYWITTHWPHRVDEPADEPPDGVYAQDRNQSVIQRLSPGDYVWIYESLSGRTVIETRADGTERRVPCRKGREGVVGLFKVADFAIERTDSQREEYADGSSAWWRYFARVRSQNSFGFVTRQQLNEVLGYAPGYNFRGFGEDHSGIKEIDESTSTRLLQIFRATGEEWDRRQLSGGAGHPVGGSGEGPEHFALKRAIAEDPCAVLGERGLTLVRDEWPFSATGDRIDVLLVDSVGRYLAVEVEVDCDAVHIAGPLQCMKYRAMLAYRFRRRMEEVRCMLVAHSIHPDVATWCSAYGIECRAIARGANVTGAGRR